MRSFLIDDVYLTIADVDDQAIVLSVLIFPLQRLLWVGGLIVVAGGLVALGRSVRIRPGTKPTEQAKDAARG